MPGFLFFNNLKIKKRNFKIEHKRKLEKDLLRQYLKISEYNLSLLIVVISKYLYTRLEIR